MGEDKQIRTGLAEPVVLHVLPVGGGMVSLSPLPGMGGAYRGDLDHLAHWRPAFVVSLVTHAELVEAGIKDLGPDIQDKGTRWVHLPIRAGEAPDDKLGATWPTISLQARKALLGGGRVMINSSEGLRRSGMLALRLMIEAGEAPDEAQTRLGTVQGGLFMNEEQLAWALKATREPVPFVRHARSV